MAATTSDAANAGLADFLVPTGDDVVYEEELLRNPYSLKLWLRYLQAKQDAHGPQRTLLYERALKSIPGSYKVWFMYLKERKTRVYPRCIDDPAWETLNNTFERALVWMHKMPRIWLEYLQVLMKQRKVTRTRKTFDRALRSLPITQHNKIWKLYIEFAQNCGVAETGVRIFRRYLKLEQDGVEDYIEFLIKNERWDEAAKRLADALNREEFSSKKNKSKHQLWLELCDLSTKHAPDIKSIKVDPILRGAIRRFTDETGRLWTSLADYYVRLGLFDKARDIFEEAVGTVSTVRDFSVVFDAYTTFEESMISARMEMAEEEGAEDVDDLDPQADDLDLRIARLELLVDRRPEMLSSVLLRQNPNNVLEWHKRVALFVDDPDRTILTYAEAVKTVDPRTQCGRPHTLWVAFAKYYEENDDVENARVILQRACKVEYRTVEELASVWCEWIEMELRHDNYEEALDVVKKSLQGAPRFGGREARVADDAPVQDRLWRSTRLWSFYVDLEESLGDLDSAKAVYERMIDVKVCTPQIILNYAHMMEENKYFEDMFRVFEKGVNMFRFPLSLPIWTTYMTKFVERYGGSKLERARDLFEQLLSKIPNSQAYPFYLMYAKLEEDYGLTKNAMAIYDRGTKAVAVKDKYQMYLVYVTKAAESFGVTKTRPIYEAAMEALPDRQLLDVALRYSKLERQLGEIDRARAIYVYASQFADPRVESNFWDAFNGFEVEHGNEDTFREMLRIKRSVQLSYAQRSMMTTDAAAIAGGTLFEPESKRGRVESDMERLEREAEEDRAKASQGHARRDAMAELEGSMPMAGLGAGGGPTGGASGVESNPDEIDLDDDLGMEEIAVPNAVFGGMKDKAEGKPMGARDRFKAKGK